MVIHHLTGRGPLKIPKSEQPRFYIVIGKAEYINVYQGHLQYATQPLRGGRQKTIYVHVGRPIPDYHPRMQEYNSCFDAFLQAPRTLRDTIIDLLYHITIEMPRQGSAS